jgi:hypothetical protein
MLGTETQPEGTESRRRRGRSLGRTRRFADAAKAEGLVECAVEPAPTRREWP